MTLNPRLYILKTRILTGLADAVWRHQEHATSKSTKEEMTEDRPSQALSATQLDWRLHGYWRGGFEASTGDYPQWRKLWRGSEDNAFRLQKTKEHALRLEEMANRGEREVLMELVLRACILSGYGHAGSLVLSRIVAQGGWSWINYASTWPEEYRFEDLALREEAESTDGLPGQWGVRGYAVVPPPIRTIPKALPQDLINNMAVSIIDSTAEGRGLGQVLSDLDRLGTVFGKDQVGIPTLIPKLISVWESQNNLKGGDAPTGERLLQFIQRWEEKLPRRPPPGEVSVELQLWHRVLQSYINLEAIGGVLRVWKEMEKRLRILMPQNDAPLTSQSGTFEYSEELDERKATHYFHPPWILGPFLTLLHRNKRIKIGLSLLSPQGDAPFPTIPKHYYHLPAISPPLIALATLCKDIKLLNDIISALPFKLPGGVPHTTLTSVMNAYLRVGDFASSQEVITYIKSQGHQLDGIDVAVLVENTLRRDKQEGFRFAERIVERGLQLDPINKVPPTRWVRSEWGTWHLPFKAAAGKGSHDFLAFEGEKIRTRSELPPTSAPAKMSPSAWLSVLNHAVEDNDRTRTEQAIKALGVDLRKRNTLSTKVFNILLKGVVARDGALQGWDMIVQHCVRDRDDGRPRVFLNDTEDGNWQRSTGHGREWEWVHTGREAIGVRADVITFKTVLDEAVREKDNVLKENKLEWWKFHENEGWGEKEPELLKGQDPLQLMDLGKAGDEVKGKEEQLKEWKKGMKVRKKKIKSLDWVINHCRDRLQKIGEL